MNKLTLPLSAPKDKDPLAPSAPPPRAAPTLPASLPAPSTTEVEAPPGAPRPAQAPSEPIHRVEPPLDAPAAAAAGCPPGDPLCNQRRDAVAKAAEPSKR
jgi:hypothetical protein